MTGRLFYWLDHRTGYRKALEVLLIEHIPGGAKWRYVWGSTLVFVFSVQMITGLLLMTAYSPGDSTAWSSVWYIQYQMDFGWLIRGLHHFGSQTMVVLLCVHMLQVVIAGAHLPPREINWWLGLMLLGIVLGLSLTGYLLPWDQKGYWATQVATAIASNIPVMGPEIQKIVVGGPSYGHATLTRFFALHVAILPPLMIVLIIAHMVVFRRHGVTVPLVTMPTDAEGEPIHSSGDSWFWPDQVFRDMLACLVTFAVLLSLVLYGHGHALEPANETAVSDPAEATAAPPSLWQRWAHAGRLGKGANLDAPADPGTGQYPARPEWYFLFLFQLLKYFKGTDEIIGTVVIPTGVGTLLAILPLLGFGPMRKFGHVVGVLVVSAILICVALLTYMAIADDHAPFHTSAQLEALAEGREPELTTEQKDDIKLLKQSPSKTAHFEKALDFQVNVRKAEKAARRAVQLAGAGIPADGPIQLLRRDPETRGRELFKDNCASCHTYGTEFANDHGKASNQPKASDFEDFGTEAWIRGLLNNPRQPKYFGRTQLEDMTGWSADNREKEDGAKDADFDQIAHWLAGHPTTSAPPPAFKKFCIRCHSFDGKGGTTTGSLGPDFTGYGSPAWVRLMITAPDHPLRYGRGIIRNAMPAFRSDIEGPLADIAKQDYAAVRNSGAVGKKEGDKKDVDKFKFLPLSDLDRELIIRFLFKDPRAVFGGDPIADQPRK